MALSLPALPVQAQSLTQSIFSKLLGTDTDEPAINYSERAPLVIPPKRDLVSPQSKAELEADPAWPKDPDVEKRRKKAASAESRGPASSNSELLSDEEMAAGTLTGPARDQRSPAQADREYEKMSNPVNPKVLAKRGSFGTEETPLDPTVCPTRKSLIDPPDCINKPLASAPLDGNEPLPSELSAEENKPWYEKVWKFGGGN